MSTQQPLFLDADAELPEVIQRMRSSTSAQVALVIPASSQLGSSRLNLKLIQQYAQRLGKHVVVVSPDPKVGGLASDLGISAYPSVAHYQQAYGLVG